MATYYFRPQLNRSGQISAFAWSTSRLDWSDSPSYTVKGNSPTTTGYNATNNTDIFIFDEKSNYYPGLPSTQYSIAMDSTVIYLNTLRVTNPVYDNGPGVITITGPTGNFIRFVINSILPYSELTIDNGVNWQYQGVIRESNFVGSTASPDTCGFNLSVGNGISLLGNIGTTTGFQHIVMYSDVITTGIMYCRHLSLSYYNITCQALLFVTVSGYSYINSDNYYYGNLITITGGSGTVFQLSGINPNSTIYSPYAYLNLNLQFTYSGAGTRTIQFDLANNSFYVDPLISCLFNCKIAASTVPGDNVTFNTGGLGSPFNDFSVYNSVSTPRTITLFNDLAVYGDFYLERNNITLSGTSGDLWFLSNPQYTTGSVVQTNGSTINTRVLFLGDDLGFYNNWTFVDNFTVGFTSELYLLSGNFWIDGITMSCGYLRIASQAGASFYGFPLPVIIETYSDCYIQVTSPSSAAPFAATVGWGVWSTLDPSATLLHNGSTSIIDLDPGNLDLSLATPYVTIKLAGLTSTSGSRRMFVGGAGTVFDGLNYMNLWVSAGAGGLVIEPRSGYAIGNLDFRGFTGYLYAQTTTQNAGIATIYGSVYLGNAYIPPLSSTNTPATDQYLWIFDPQDVTSPGSYYTSLFSTNFKTVNWPIALKSTVGNNLGEIKIVDNLIYDLNTGGASGGAGYDKVVAHPLILDNGIFNPNNKTVTVTTASMVSSSSDMLIYNGTISCNTFTHAGSLAIDAGGALVITRSPLIFNGGYIVTFNTTTITCPSFVSNTTVSSTGTINFDTGYINVTDIGTSVTPWQTSDISYLTFTDNGGGVRLTGNGTSGTRNINHGNIDSETNSVNFYVTAGTDAVRFTSPIGVKTLNITGFSGILYSQYNSIKIYKDLILSSGSALFNLSMYFSASSGINTITTNNNPLISTNIKFIFDNTATWKIMDNVNGLSQWTLNRGTLDLNGKTVSINQFYSNTTTNRTLTMNSSTVLMTNNNQPYPTTWIASNPGTLSINYDSNSKIYYNSNGGFSGANAYNVFNGGGKSYNFLGLTGNGIVAGITIQSSNTFVTLQQDVYTATSWTFDAGSVTTVTNFNISGKDVNNRAVLKSSTTNTQFTLSKPGGVVTVSNTTITNSSATGGAKWFSLTRMGNINGGNNSGWIFNVISRLANTGTFYTTSVINETATSTIRMSDLEIYAKQFVELPTLPVAMRQTSTGSLIVSGEFNEVNSYQIIK